MTVSCRDFWCSELVVMEHVTLSLSCTSTTARLKAICEVGFPRSLENPNALPA